jgi:hypothetical protein
MGRIILTIAGSWSNPPDLKTDLETLFEGPDSELAEDFVFVGRRADSINNADALAVRNHTSVLRAYAEFEGPGQRSWAQKGVTLALEAVAAGAVGIFVETSCKALTPHALSNFTANDRNSVFHFYVEVMGDAETFATEGMQAFDLPEIKAYYRHDDRATAQAVVFSMAAKMVCDGFKPAAEGVFRATESAPLYEVERVIADTADDDPYTNPHGAWVLRRRLED